jgi:hypothetical protein
MRQFRIITIAILILIPHLVRAASSPLITFPGTGSLSSDGGNGTIGDLFQVGSSPLQVTSLGLFDSGAPGLNESHSVGIWTAGGALLGRADISPGLGDFSADGFVYKTLSSPVTLQPGAQYVIGANYAAGTSDLFYPNDSIESETWAPVVHFMNGRYTAHDVGFVLPQLNVFGLSYVGPNAQFTVVPEPGTISVFACAIAAFCFRPTARQSRSVD